MIENPTYYYNCIHNCFLFETNRVKDGFDDFIYDTVMMLFRYKDKDISNIYGQKTYSGWAYDSVSETSFRCSEDSPGNYHKIYFVFYMNSNIDIEDYEDAVFSVHDRDVPYPADDIIIDICVNYFFGGWWKSVSHIVNELQYIMDLWKENRFEDRRDIIGDLSTYYYENRGLSGIDSEIVRNVAYGVFLFNDDLQSAVLDRIPEFIQMNKESIENDFREMRYSSKEEAICYIIWKYDIEFDFQLNLVRRLIFALRKAFSIGDYTIAYLLLETLKEKKLYGNREIDEEQYKHSKEIAAGTFIMNIRNMLKLSLGLMNSMEKQLERYLNKVGENIEDCLKVSGLYSKIQLKHEMPNEKYKCGCVYNIDCPSLDRDAYRYVAMVIYRNGEITEKEMCDSALYIYANDMLNIIESRWGYGEIEEEYREKRILVHPEEYRK